MIYYVDALLRYERGGQYVCGYNARALWPLPTFTCPGIRLDLLGEIYSYYYNFMYTNNKIMCALQTRVIKTLSSPAAAAAPRGPFPNGLTFRAYEY